MSSINSEMLEKFILITINTKYKDAPPNEEEFMEEAKSLRKNLPVSDEEFEKIVKNLKASILITMDSGVYIYDPDADHKSWLPQRRADTELDFFYWNRYKIYLETIKEWNTRVVSSLDKVSDEILDLLGDPKSSEPWQRRGLVLGDVQSGKTANYTAICNKAADTGYKVIIVLAGMMNNLRIQTQERLDAEFAGRKSKYLLPSRAHAEIRNVFDGVGKISSKKRISAFTTATTDFNSVILNSNDMTLMNISEPALFVVKKNKKILRNLESWLCSNNADPNGKINLPLLVIDDEADNASVNTSKDDDDPTAINEAIRSILNKFYQASYLGITATPFANIFINPESDADMIGQDLFPRDFIYALSAPTNYIGSDAIFGTRAKYSDSLEEIKEKEMGDFFPFGHKKEIALNELPPSMYKAMNYFILVNACRDIRGDNTEHRSMLINISRFTAVQSLTAELITEWLKKVCSEIRNYALLPVNEALQISSIKEIYDIWNEYDFGTKVCISWEELQHKYLISAALPIEVRAVNQRTGASSLDYYAHREDGFRVIAIGGNSLSRGLTLEGLCVSYFYRNSQMYDTLLQMGRWFGYRKGYEDLFRIWMAEDAIDWYGYITLAANELKEEIGKMNRIKSSPKDFGLKVRQDPNSLIATAQNKMRSATLVKRLISVQGKLLETPRLKSKQEVLKSNERVFKLFVANLDSIGQRKESIDKDNYTYWTGVPKEMVVELLRSFNTHPWHLAYQGAALAEYIESSKYLTDWDVVIPNGSSKNTIELEGAYGKIGVKPEVRNITEANGMIKISGTKVRVGSGGCTKAGLTDRQIEKAKQEFRNSGNTSESLPDGAYLLKERNPLLMLHVIETKKEDSNNTKIPDILYALGVGFPMSDEKDKMVSYVINIVELRNWIEIEEEDEYADS